ncbi:MAG: hypothetical protein IKX14_02590 [Neisseriaceae bacterium]|nr:hypothetical protein [Neisseriaceae bacterium]
MPVITKKTTNNEGIPDGLIEERARDLSNVAKKNEVTTKAKNDKMFTIRTSETKQREYKAFFASKGLSVSKGVQIAIDYLIDQARKDTIELKDTGIFTR